MVWERLGSADTARGWFIISASGGFILAIQRGSVRKIKQNRSTSAIRFIGYWYLGFMFRSHTNVWCLEIEFIIWSLEFHFYKVITSKILITIDRITISKKSLLQHVMKLSGIMFWQSLYDLKFVCIFYLLLYNKMISQYYIILRYPKQNFNAMQ